MKSLNRELALAAETGNLAKVKALVEQGADIQARDNLALLWADKNGHTDIVKYLAGEIQKEGG